MSDNKVGRNYYIDFWKFIFSICIVLFHSWQFTWNINTSYFSNGFFAVEFYFIVTGYLFIKKIEKMKKTKSKENIGLLDIKFIYNKIKELLPSILLILIIGYIFTYRSNCLNISTMFSNSVFSEFSLLTVLGYGIVINISLWYISVMCLVLFLMFPIAYKYGKTYNYYIAPFICIFSFCFVNSFNINMYDPALISAFMINGFYRGLILINLGVICYEISNKIKEINFTNIGLILLTITESFLYLILLLNMHYGYIGTFLTTILFLIVIAITFSNLCYSNKVFKSSIFEKLGKFGFMMYLANVPVRTIIIHWYSNHSYVNTLIVYLILVVCFSVFVYIFDNFIHTKKFNKIVIKLKKIVIQ